MLSRHGAAIVSTRKLAPEQEMILRCLETHREAEARIVGQIGDHAGGYVYGVAFLDPDICLWNDEFPSLEASEKQTSRVLLKCASCQKSESVFLTELELDVLIMNEGLLRNCKNCRVSTLWKRSSGDLDAKPISTPVEEKPTAEVPADSSRNRRKDVRARVSFSACIRSSGLEEIVNCENVSRGGLCFRSRKRYPAKSTIEVAAPYLPGTPSIFVSAQIVHAHELSEGKLFRYGVAYVESAKDPPEI